MISCIYNGVEIVASDYVYKNGYTGVKNLKEASKARKLICKDPDCNMPLIFANGEKRVRYFRHYGNSTCSCLYRDYHPTEKIMTAQNVLISHFKSLDNIDVKADVKILSKHITNLALEQNGKIILAIEIIENTRNWSEWDKIHQEYMSLGINDIWINLSEPSINKNSLDMYFLTQKQLEDDSFEYVLHLDTVNKLLTLLIKHNLHNVKYKKFINDDTLKVRFELSRFFSDNQIFVSNWLILLKNHIINTCKDDYLQKEKAEDERISQIHENEVNRKKEFLYATPSITNIKDSDKSPIKPTIYNDKYKESYYDHEIAVKTVNSWLKKFMAGDAEFGQKLHGRIWEGRNAFEYHKILTDIKSTYEKERNTVAVSYCDRVIENGK